MTPFARHLAALLALVVSGGLGCRPVSVDSTTHEPLRVSPVSLELGSVYVGRQATAAVTVTNPNRAPFTFSTGVPAPFEVTPAALELGGGASVELALTLRPQAPGDISATLSVIDEASRRAVEVAVHGVGLAVPDCGVPATCETVAFDFGSEACATTRLPDGTSCTSSDACFVQAECRQGACVGTFTRCDDGDPCTIDACGELGCVHADGVYACPAPSNPCLVQTCRSDAGCGAEPVPDGTSCGPRDCHFADICVAGACVNRAVPQGQPCIELVAGRPGGCGWADGVGASARFRQPTQAAYDRAGNLFVVDPTANTVRRITPGGDVTTLAGAHGQSGTADGFRSAARFDAISGVAVDSLGNVFVAERARIRKISPLGLVTTFAGAVTPVPVTAPVDGSGSVARFVSISSLVMGPGDTLWLFDRGNELRTVSPLGEVVTRAVFGSGQFGAHALAVTPEGRVFVGRNFELSELVPDAGLVPFDVLQRDGGLAQLSADALAFEPPGNLLAVVWPEPTLTRVSLSTHLMTVTALMERGGGLGLAVDRTGHIAIPSTTGCNVMSYVGDAGVILAGPLEGPTWPTRDGPIDSATFYAPSALAVHPEGGIAVADGWSGVRRIFAGQVTSATVDGGGPYVADLVSGHGELWVGSAGALWVERDGGLERVGPLPGARAPHLALATDGLTIVTDIAGVEWLVRWTADAGAMPVASTAFLPSVTGGVVGDGADGIFHFARFSLRHFDGLGQATLIAGGTAAGDVDGPPGQARFGGTEDFPGVPSGIARDGTGTVYVADTGSHSVRRVDVAGNVQTIARLADGPLALLVEDGGTLLVAVPGAVQRIRP